MVCSVYASLENLGYGSSEIERALLACKSQGIQPDTDWCRYYLAQITVKTTTNITKMNHTHNRLHHTAPNHDLSSTTTAPNGPMHHHQHRPHRPHRDRRRSPRRHGPSTSPSSSSMPSSTSSPAVPSSSSSSAAPHDASGPPPDDPLQHTQTHSASMVTTTDSTHHLEEDPPPPSPPLPDGNALSDLSDLNPFIFCELKCDGFMLNGHQTERSEAVLQILTKIYDLFFDFLYESQLSVHRHSAHSPTNGFRGRLSPKMVRSLLSERNVKDGAIDGAAARKWAAILGLDSLSGTALGRDQLNVVLRLLSMHQHGVAESFWSFVDPQVSIVPLPAMPMPPGFVSFLEQRYPDWAVVAKDGALSDLPSNSTLQSTQYAMGPPGKLSMDHRMSLDTMYEDKEVLRGQNMDSLVVLNVVGHGFALCFGTVSASSSMH